MTQPWSAKCACGHLVLSHVLLSATKKLPQRRGACTHMDDTGQCQCKGPR